MALRFSRDWPERTPILEVFRAALSSVDPELAVRAATYPISVNEPVTVIAIGKAAPAMARGVSGPATGIVVSDHVEPLPDRFVSYVGGHPLPDSRSLTAAEAVVSFINTTDGPILFLISGGASALCELPAPGLSIEDVAVVTASLLRSGADIASVNTVRKHLSQIKGGRLAALTAGRPARSLLMSDVVGDREETIGSGPTVPDSTTIQDALDVVARHDVALPKAVAAYLAGGARGDSIDTPGEPLPSHEVVVIANGAVAAAASVSAAQRLGLSARVETTELRGDAASAAGQALEVADDDSMTIFTGETTVEVSGSGSGGRNQHAALAAAVQIDGAGDRLMFGALATDGVDGPTDGAGAVVDGGSVARGLAAGLDARAHLANHDSHPFLQTTGDLLRIGPSGTNVGDLWVVWRR